MTDKFKYYYLLFAESYVAILVFTVFFLLLMVKIFMPYQSYLLNDTITNQLNAYNLSEIATADMFLAGLDIVKLKYANAQMTGEKYDNQQRITDAANDHYNGILYIILGAISGTLLIGLSIPIIMGRIKLRELPWRQFLFAFILHMLFIIGLETYLLLCVIKPYTSLRLYTMFDGNLSAECAKQDAVAKAGVLLAMQQYMNDENKGGSMHQSSSSMPPAPPYWNSY
jgi:hypothetical protein